MTKHLCTQLLIILAFCFGYNLHAQNRDHDTRKQLYEFGTYNPYQVLDTRVDNMRYWKKAAELGLTPVDPYRQVPPGIFKSDRIDAFSVMREDSPDVPVTEVNSTQSENSVFVDPNDPDHVLQSNNSTENPVGSLYGANYFFSYDFGLNWGGSVQGAGGANSGDPATAIGLNGRQFVGFIHSNGGQGIAYSDDGVNWTSVQCGTPPGGWDILDKNHMWIDNSPASPYQGHIYSAWTGFGNANDADIEFVRSTNNGQSYSAHLNISSAVNAGSHNQGVNLQTGPDGEVYAAWAIYDSWPSDESAIGFAKSYNGGASFQPAERIITNIRGIRTSETSKNHRVNSFPVMAVDISGGSMNGNIYIVWANIGVPGINSGPDIDIYLIRSEDEGETWSAPVRVNQDDSGLGNEHYFPWITCDPESGALSVIFYDDRNVGGAKCEVFCANSFDGGITWEDFRVSDTDFTPSPIPGLAGGYMGDYLGISARGGKVYPVWTDNRTGSVMTYISPYETNMLPRPENLTASLTFANGQVDLSWDFETVPGFQYFVVYRDNVETGTTTGTSFTDYLPDYGIFSYKVTAMHDEGESSAAMASVQWGDAHIAVDPAQIVENIGLNSTATRQVTIENTGELDLVYQVSSSTDPAKSSRSYCIPTADCSFGDGITSFALGTISNNNSGCSPNGFGDFTSMSTELQTGNSYEVTLATGYDDQFVTIWIDFDKDEEFEASEKVLDGFELLNAGQNYTATITIPDGAESGPARMRVIAEWLNVPTDPCENMSYGETEDYTVIISGWMQVDHVTDTVQPGDSHSIEVLFDSNDLTEGTYTGNINIQGNDPDLPEVNVPVTLNVAVVLPLEVDVTATPATVMSGESSQLEAVASGGTGNYSFAWTSDPPGFTSDIPNPVVFPDETTTYFAEVNDGLNAVTGQVTVTVLGTITQTITLSQGWNIMSSRAMPSDPDMLAVMQPLIGQDLLYKVLDEAGGSVIHLPFPPPNGQWNNSIGNMQATEGYYIKVNNAATLDINGDPVPLPLEIPLSQGWNIISYPCTAPQDAMAAVQPLIDAGVLYKVLDEAGGVIVHLPFPPPNGQWTNSIGNFENGKGYYIKVNENTSLTLDEPAIAVAGREMADPKTSYFTPCYHNNPYMPSSVIIKTSGWMEPGDEFGVFDGETCVGAGIYTGRQQDYFLIPVAMDDPGTEAKDGATRGNSLQIHYWNLNGQTLIENLNFDILEGTGMFAALGTSVLEPRLEITQLYEIDKSIRIRVIPNPVREMAQIVFSLPKAVTATVMVSDLMGTSKATIAENRKIHNGSMIGVNPDELGLKPGIYTCRIVLRENKNDMPLVRMLKFVVL